MIDGAQVRADGVEAEAGKTPTRSVLLSSLLVSVLVLGFVVISIGVPVSQPVATTQPGTAIPPPVDLRDSEQGIGEVVTGFQDALVGIAVDSEGDALHVLWPNARPLVAREATAAPDASFDKSGVFIATLSARPAGGGAELLAGRVNSLRSISDNVSSFAWHDGEAGLLGFIVDRNEHREVWQVVPGFGPSHQFDVRGATPRLVAWGDWGYAFEDNGGITLLTREGELKASYEEARVLASRGDGWLLTSGKSIDLLSAGGGVVRTEIGPTRVGLAETASFSPDRQFIAVVGSRGVLVSPIRGGGETKELHVDDARDAIWSADSRFLIVPRTRGISLFDLQSVNQFFVLEDESFNAVGIIALDES